MLRKHTAAVSALALTNDDTELVSGAWDRGVHVRGISTALPQRRDRRASDISSLCRIHFQQWDLHTGQVVRSYAGHGGQISSLSFRPLYEGNDGARPSRRSSPVSVSIRASAAPARSKSRSASRSPEIPLAESVQPGNVRAASQHQQSKSPIPALATGPGSEEPTAHDPDEAQRLDPPLDSGVGGSAVQGEVDVPTADELALAAELSESLGREIESGIGGADDANQPAGAAGKSPNTTPGSNNENNRDSDADSLFGDGDEDGEGDADGDGEADADGDGDGDADADADADGEAEADGHADGDAEDASLPASRGLTEVQREGSSRPLGLLGLPGSGARPGSARFALPNGSSSGNAATPLGGKSSRTDLPGANLPGGSGNASTANGTSPLPGPNGSSSTTSKSRPVKPLQRPAFALGLEFDGDVSRFSNDILLTSTLGGQVMLWDRRVKSTASGTSHSRDASGGGGVRALPLPEKTPPWCASACWSARGDRIYVGRRNESVDEWDLRMIPDAGTGTGNRPGGIANPRFVRSLRFPQGSGPVSALAAMPNGSHIVW